MSDDDCLNFDLFGPPSRSRGPKRGRPAHVFSREFAENIAVLSAAGRTQAEIAGLVGLSEKTLVKYYSASLERGHELVLGATLIETFKALKAGRGWAANLLMKVFDGELEGATRTAARVRQAAPAEKPEKIGKKAEAQIAGETAHESTEWATLLRH